MTEASLFSGRVEPLDGDLPALTYAWDAETEILSCHLDVKSTRGLTGSIELEDAQGAIVTLDFVSGVMQGLEVVVWPEMTRVDLSPPATDERGRFVVPARPSQPGIAVLEVDAVLWAEATSDESTIHVGIGGRRPTRGVALADKLLLDVDERGEPAGFWLLSVPPFPQEREV
ncbi:MAG: hypothetical protein OEO20_05420 [Gemmatimonadota bacterium]|nr:hypothetical protein [Gemmatimonadota bacterium]MDH3366576.1 hypothetical protein [Gemmatimonadota bacterium]MDH3477723.1 hypothetical protein [Gemmatimonadota bacterium]MDH3571941.1 hypothetical protein [Gemmatimonadota bacterium]MDH5548854.1 hypothetical protein [Gemmatimonadota bacterium]